MPNRSKAKGNKWENDVCKLMGDVFGLSFKRVPTSGAMTGGINAQILALLSESQKLLLRGDIIVPDELSKLVIECKSRKTFPFHQLLETCRELDDWVEQINHDLTSDDLIGLIIFKANRRTPFVCYDVKWFKHLQVGTTTDPYISYWCGDDEYIIESFTTKWVEKNKEALLKICLK